MVTTRRGKEARRELTKSQQKVAQQQESQKVRKQKSRTKLGTGEELERNRVRSKGRKRDWLEDQYGVAKAKLQREAEGYSLQLLQQGWVVIKGADIGFFRSMSKKVADAIASDTQRDSESIPKRVQGVAEGPNTTEAVRNMPGAKKQRHMLPCNYSSKQEPDSLVMAVEELVSETVVQHHHGIGGGLTKGATMFTRATAGNQWPHWDDREAPKGLGKEVPLIALWALPPPECGKKYKNDITATLETWPESHGQTDNEEVNEKWGRHRVWDSYEELLAQPRVIVALRPGDMYLGKVSIVHRGTARPQLPARTRARANSSQFGLARVHWYGKTSAHGHNINGMQGWVRVKDEKYKYDKSPPDTSPP
jgi:hypothetical protein